ncbi:hypothetical protein ACFOYU_08635 [Microvirga sp. GCM10011540]|uniref:hypothetical protein n=1 Tax=Microvirga sp. GCM10011540 TaxID=3317338 RepID=UPI003621F4E5
MPPSTSDLPSAASCEPASLPSRLPSTERPSGTESGASPGQGSFLGPFAYEELAGGACSALQGVVPQLSPATRLRLSAFIHLIKDPAGMKASLELRQGGGLCLTLTADAADARLGQASSGTR